MLGLKMGKKVALGTLTTAILAASVLFFVANLASAQSGVEKSQSAQNITRGQNAATVSARPGDIIEYRLQFRNTENLNRQVTIEDDISDLNALSELLSVSDSGERSGDILRWRDVQINANQTLIRTFRARIKQERDVNNTPRRTMSNTFGNTININIFASGTDSNATRSKTAYNETQNRPAQEVTARAGDVITYTLTYRNQSDLSQVVTVEDDLADVLYLSEIIDLGGGRMVGNTIRFENVSVPESGRIDYSFKVRVKNMPAGTQDYLMSNFYGNGVDIRVEIPAATPPKGQQPPIPPKTAPETGTSENLALLLAGLVTGMLYTFKQNRFA